MKKELKKLSNKASDGNINEKLDQIITLLKLANKKTIDEVREKIKEDEVYNNILITLENNEIEYSKLIENLLKTTDKKERTIQTRISDLVDMGVLNKKRQGGKVLYSISNLFS